MSAQIIDFQEWAESRARLYAQEHLSEWGWLPSGIEALISLMGLPAGEKGEATAVRLREEVRREAEAHHRTKPGREAR